jgi:hypothetical protein
MATHAIRSLDAVRKVSRVGIKYSLASQKQEAPGGRW